MEDISTKVQTYSGHVVWLLFPVNASPSVLGLPLGTSRYKAYVTWVFLKKCYACGLLALQLMVQPHYYVKDQP